LIRLAFWQGAAVAVLGVLAAAVAARRRRSSALPYTGPFGFRPAGVLAARFPDLLLLASVASLLAATARPQSGWERLPRPGEGVDIVLALDVSTSMLAEDYRPNRLEAARDAAEEFISGRPGDRVSLVAYAAEAMTLCPPTLDHGTLRRLLDTAGPGLLPDGTSIGQGLAVAAAGLEYSRAERRVIVLLSDGVETVGAVDPVTVARAVSTLHGDSLRLYTVAVGTTSPALGYEVDRQTLATMAELCGGRLFDAYSAADLREVYASIDSLERSTLPEEGLFVYRDHHMPLVLLGVCLLVLSLLLRWGPMKVVGE
jgi:Ca-activated chloride channel family protein